MQLPPEARVVGLAASFANLCGRLRDECAEPKLVLPNGAFFPDAFDPSARGVQRLLTRMQAHAGMTDVPIEVVVHDAETGTSEGGCSSGACAPRPSTAELQRLELEGDNWLLHLQRPEIGHAVGLTTLLARCLGGVLLEDVRREGEPPLAGKSEWVELAAMRLGFGVLLLEGAYVYSKSCGGPQINTLTTLDVADLSVVLALYARAFDLPLRAAYSLLSTTQHSALVEAEALVRANAWLAEWVRQGAPGTAPPRGLQPAKPRLLQWLTNALPARGKAEGSDLLGGEFDELQFAAEAGGFTSSPKRLAPGRDAKTRPGDDLGQLVAEALAENAAAAPDTTSR